MLFYSKTVQKEGYVDSTIIAPATMPSGLGWSQVYAKNDDLPQIRTIDFGMYFFELLAHTEFSYLDLRHREPDESFDQTLQCITAACNIAFASIRNNARAFKGSREGIPS